MRTVQVCEPEDFSLQAGPVRFHRYALVRGDETLPNGAPRPSTMARDAMDFYSGELRTIAGAHRLPFSAMNGDLEDKFSECFLQDFGVVSSRVSFMEWTDRRPAIVRTLSEYVRLRLALERPAHDEVQAHLCGLRFIDGVYIAEIGAGLWSDSRRSMDAGHIVIERRDGDGNELGFLTEQLLSRFGSVSIRSVMSQNFSRENFGWLLPFGSGHYQFTLGVCSVIFCERDQKFVITRRGRNVHVNAGRVAAASGGVKWECFQKHGELFSALDATMAEELREEIGEGNFRIVRAGCAREIPREGSPEFFYTIFFSGGVPDLLQIMAKNEHPDSAEVDGFVYAFGVDDAWRLLRSVDGVDVVHYKGLMNLYLSLR